MTSRCHYCRREIKWIKIPEGEGLKNIPIDLKAAVWHQDLNGNWTRSAAFVSHSSVCTSRKKQVKPVERPEPEKETPWWTK